MITALALATVIQSCEWSAPRGQKPLMTPFDQVIDQFRDIPPDARKALIANVRAGRFVDQIEIRKDKITGKDGSEYANLRQMNFADGSRCNVVTRKTWTDLDMETALIYSAKGPDGTEYFLVRPEVCRNWSLITQTKPRRPVVPPSPMRVDMPAAPVDPLPVTADAPIPPVEPGPLTVVLPPQSFARLVEPEPDLSRPADEYERISADQTWVEYRSWRLLGPVSYELPSLLPSIVGSPEPVPGITPPSVIPEPAPVQPAPVKPVAPDGSPVPSSVAPIPEPGTWALMLLGLGMLMVLTRQVKGAA